MFTEKPYDMPWRRVYEGQAGLAWALCAVFLWYAELQTFLPTMPVQFAAMISWAFAAARFYQAVVLWNRKFALAGKTLFFMPPEQLLAKMKLQAKKVPALYLGSGFTWELKHSQRLYDLKRFQLEDFMPPAIFVRIRGFFVKDQSSKDDPGDPTIHGVETKESDVQLPLKFLEGHAIVVGTTGAGKTFFLMLNIFQAINRGKNNATIVIDPKGDPKLKEFAEREAKRAGKPFYFFHPAFPDKSCRLDTLKNWTQVTNVASRVASLIESDEVFKSFAWDAANVIFQSMVFVEDRPSLRKLRRYVECGLDSLLERVLAHHFRLVRPNWQAEVAAYMEPARRAKQDLRAPPGSVELLAYIQYYKDKIQRTHNCEIANSALNVYSHNREHYSKLIASLIPVLNMLTSGDVGKLLSPDYEDIHDRREIIDSRKIINTGAVFFMGLDSMSDPFVASSIASLTLADFTSVAGQIYNFGNENNNEVSIYIDEASEVVSPPFLPLINKSRGAGYRIMAATQTVPDFVAKLGTDAEAFQILGNFNNVIALRLIDQTTKDYVAEYFGDGWIKSFRYSMGTGASSETGMGAFNGSESVTMADALEQRIPTDVLNSLPNFHFFLKPAGGDIIKGRYPIVT
jgi:conjugal transfer pilus assembly protein TraD